jgi:hypothetical protein
MPLAADFQLAQVQAVAFTPDVNEFSPARVFAAVFESYRARYTGAPISLPLPDGAPDFVPAVVLKSADDTWRLDAAPARLTSTWSRTRDDHNLSLHDAVDACAEVVAHYIAETGVRVARLALVVRRSCRDPAPPQTLIARFASERAAAGPFRNSRTFEVHNHKAYPVAALDDLRINSWMRCKTGFVVSPDRPAVIVEQDLNTLAEEQDQQSFSPARSSQFFAAVAKEADEILQIYFGTRRAHPEVAPP